MAKCASLIKGYLSKSDLITSSSCFGEVKGTRRAAPTEHHRETFSPSFDWPATAAPLWVTHSVIQGC